MTKRETYTIQCIVTGNEETYEIMILEAKQGGRNSGNRTVEIRQPPSCLNVKCKFRTTADCPVEQMKKKQ